MNTETALRDNAFADWSVKLFTPEERATGKIRAAFDAGWIARATLLASPPVQPITIPAETRQSPAAPNKKGTLIYKQVIDLENERVVPEEEWPTPPVPAAQGEESK